MTYFSVKKVYTWKMRNSEPDSKYFVESLDFFSIPCQNPQKPPQNYTLCLLCGFLRNWSVIISMLCGHKIALSSHRCHFMQGYWELEGPVQTTAARDPWDILSHKRCPRVAQSRRTCGVCTASKLHENVINPWYSCWPDWTIPFFFLVKTKQFLVFDFGQIA